MNYSEGGGQPLSNGGSGRRDGGVKAARQATGVTCVCLDVNLKIEQ